jgi:hypothetical protein
MYLKQMFTDDSLTHINCTEKVGILVPKTKRRKREREKGRKKEIKLWKLFFKKN